MERVSWGVDDLLDVPPLTHAGAHEHPRPMLMQRFGAHAQPGASALRPRVLLTVPVRVSYTPRASPDIPSHHARSVDSRTPHTVSAHAARNRPRCPSTRNPSNIYPNHGRTPRHHHARAARSPWAIVAWCSCQCGDFTGRRNFGLNYPRQKKLKVGSLPLPTGKHPTSHFLSEGKTIFLEKIFLPKFG